MPPACSERAPETVRCTAQTGRCTVLVAGFPRAYPRPELTRIIPSSDEAVMRHALRILSAVALLARVAAGPAPLSAQPSAPVLTAEQRRAAFEAHQGDFDYLLGDWEFTATSREYGTYGGLWSAVRLPDGAQVLDEFRALGDSGETLYVTRTIRSYNAALDRWELAGLDEANGLQDFGTGRREGSEMHIEQRFATATGSPFLMRIRYYDIGPDRFSWAAERSRDGGRSWEPDYLRIEARRIGPARHLGRLAPTRRPSSVGR
jgi:hypothetical protein